MPKRKKKKPGPKPDHLTLKGPWVNNVRRAITKKRPATGWPKHHKKKSSARP